MAKIREVTLKERDTIIKYLIQPSKICLSSQNLLIVCLRRLVQRFLR